GRLDRFRTEGEVSQRTAPAFTTTYQSRSEQRFSPKLALVSRPDPEITLRASLGTGFRPPTLLDLYSRTVSPTTVAGVFSVNEPAPDLKAERIGAAEIGAEWRGRSGTTIAGALFSQSLTGLIYRSRKNPTLTQSVNAGRAKITGLELEARRRLADTPLVVFANLSMLARSEITENAALPASVGKKLTDVPARMANIGLEFNQGAWTGSLVARHVSHIYGSGDDLNANVVERVFGSYDARTTVSAKLAWHVTPYIQLALAVDNLANRQYFDFFKQPGTSAFAEIALRY
ncbi:MAG TPA: TonB-dependent receptor, partial [Usitatibacteraceae bacterium]|nr:TonB-dependent receptor [Usitatibacteraceae bacterium]